ncbi:seryl-tRNA synthetase [Dichomitus squalens LYAD-421 SS1]|uniref:seryl-tRNA synthetase n=1 Tax=Dichomitus squalens (strain LYAD-421) TaxID=732165 RepID=UPI00044114B5|nr:seryl-tRNA synthetase [Dichomitus squalens LYAD-421 SS1]EJF66817.1 seryl-tRNA synthetase [Dichomitus squalens LYAD-421 SS1]
MRRWRSTRAVRLVRNSAGSGWDWVSCTPTETWIYASTRWMHNACLRRSCCLSLRAYSTGPDRAATSTSLPKPRLDYRDISENVVFKSHNAFNRKAPLPVGAVQTVARLYEEQKDLSQTLNAKRHARSVFGERIRTLAQDPQKKQAVLDEAKALKAEISELEDRVAQLEDELHTLSLAIPNDTHPEVPIGPESVAVTLSTHGPEPIPASPARDHVSICRALDILDLEAGATVTGSSWYYLKNEAALLELALTNYALSIALKYGYTPVTTPDVVRADIARRCGFQPRDPVDGAASQMYHLAHTADPAALPSHGHPELVLAGTAEIPLAGMFANRILSASELPAKVVGLGHAFRAEAGARGADTRGLYRVHQFTKLELFVVSGEESSGAVMEEMRKMQAEIFEGLGLSFRVLEMPTEELGASAYRKYDAEAWMPGRGGWGEISSTSNCTDYQARRLHIRYRRQTPPSTDGSSHPAEQAQAAVTFAHTLNGTAAAVPRLIVALVENGAVFDGSGTVVGLKLPRALQPFWVGGNPRGLVQWDIPGGAPAPAPSSFPPTSICTMTSLYKQAYSAFVNEKPRSSITEWVEILTSSNYDAEAYDGIPEIVESINIQATGPAEASRAIRKKIKHGDPHAQYRALHILKALVENGGPKIQSSFNDHMLIDAIKHLAADPATDSKVKKKLTAVLAGWRRQFADDPSMQYVAKLYDQCKMAQADRISADKRAIEQVNAGIGVDPDYIERERKRKEAEARKKKEEEKRKAKEEKEKRRREEEERRRKASQPKTKRKPFNFEQEKPQILTAIANASQAASNLVNAMTLVNPQQESYESSTRVQECLVNVKQARKQIVRYIQLVENEDMIGVLIETNDRIIAAIENYDLLTKPDTTEAQVKEIQEGLAAAKLSTGELAKLQDKQRAAINRSIGRSGTSSMGPGSGDESPTSPSSPSYVHPDLQDLQFGALGSEQRGLPPPIRPTSARRSSSENDDTYRRGSLSDYSDYQSSDEDTHNRAGPSSSVQPRRGYVDVSDDDSSHDVRRDPKQSLLRDTEDPFADPFAD